MFVVVCVVRVAYPVLCFLCVVLRIFVFCGVDCVWCVVLCVVRLASCDV